MIYDHRTYSCRSGTIARHLKLYEEFGWPVQSRHLGQPTWCDCGGRSPGANEVRYVGLMDISREENVLWNTMSVWMCR